MAEQKPDYHALFDELIDNADFRASFVKDPVGTLRDRGYEVVDDDVARFQDIDWAAVDQAFRELGKRTFIT